MSRQLAYAALLLGGLVACGPKQGPSSAGGPAPDAAGATDAAEAAAAAEPVWNEQRLKQQYNMALSLLSAATPAGAKQALDVFAEIGQNEPDLAEVPYNEGVAWMVLGDVETARKRFLRATDIDPTLTVAWQNLGALDEERGDLDQALQRYRSGLRHAPEDGPLRAAEISVLRQKKQHDAAIRQAKAAIQADSNNVGAYNQLGLVYLETGQVELAQFIYQRALQIVAQAKSDPQMYANLGRVYFAQGQVRAAEEQFQKALTLDPNLVLARLYIADMAIENRDYATVVATLEPTLAIAPDNASVHLNLGIGYRGTGRLEEAKKSYEKALELKPNDPSPYLNLAVLLGDHFKEYDKALGMLDTYQRQGGKQSEMVEAWRKDFGKQKKRLDMEAKRRKRREDADRRRKDAEAAQRRIDEQKAREAAEAAAAAQQAEPQEQQQAAPVPAGAAQSESAPTPASGTVPATTGTMPDPVPAADSSQAPTAADPPVPVNTEAPAETAPVPLPEPSPAAVAPATSAGQACSSVGSCGSGLECANDAVCRPAAAPGTYGEGIGCFQDADCAYGLSCTSNKCAQPGAGGSAGPWGN